MSVTAIRGHGRALLTAVVVAVAFFVIAAPASAQENGFTCRAEALNATVFQQDQLQPLVAGSTSDFCINDSGGLPGAGQATLPDLLRLDGAYAVTHINDADLAPAYQVVTADSGAADARIDPDGNLLRVEAIEASSKAFCENRQLKFESTGHVAKLFVFGTEVPLNDGLTQLINGIDEVTQALVHIELNEEVVDASGYTFRALHVSIAHDGEVVDAVVGENHFSAIGDPCNDFTGSGPGPQTPDRPIVGLPYGGGNVVNLGDVRGARGSECKRSKAFGRKIAIVGTNRRDTIVGSRFADRIFVFGSPDIVSSGRGRDCVEGGTGNDPIHGDLGNDTLYGRKGKDKLDGGLGHDKVYGGPGRDRVLAGLGKDRLFGGPGGDKISGRGGGDRISGGGGNDRIYADFRGNRDRIKCGKGHDVVMADRYDVISRDCESVGVNISTSIR
jgi:Ca2+-binding RTX toxin-like protein